MHLEKEIGNLKQKVLLLGGIVEKAMELSLQSYLKRDKKLAQKVITENTVIYNLEVEIEEQCLRVLALYQPVAGDLRYVVALLEINSNLAGIGDLMVNISRKSRWLAVKSTPLKLNLDYETLCFKTGNMLHLALEALVDQDINLAYNIIAADSEINKMKRDFRREIINLLKQKSNVGEILFRHYSVVRNLERTADIAVHIAEKVIYIQTARIVRHNHIRIVE